MPMFYAHSTAKEDRSDWQPLQDHLRAVGLSAQEKAGVFGAGALGYIAGLLHDLG